MTLYTSVRLYIPVGSTIIQMGAARALARANGNRSGGASAGARMVSESASLAIDQSARFLSNACKRKRRPIVACVLPLVFRKMSNYRRVQSMLFCLSLTCPYTHELLFVAGLEATSMKTNTGIAFFCRAFIQSGSDDLHRDILIISLYEVNMETFAFQGLTFRVLNQSLPIFTKKKITFSKICAISIFGT